LHNLVHRRSSVRLPDSNDECLGGRRLDRIDLLIAANETDSTGDRTCRAAASGNAQSNCTRVPRTHLSPGWGSGPYCGRSKLHPAHAPQNEILCFCGSFYMASQATWSRSTVRPRPEAVASLTADKVRGIGRVGRARRETRNKRGTRFRAIGRPCKSMGTAGFGPARVTA